MAKKTKPTATAELDAMIAADADAQDLPPASLGRLTTLAEDAAELSRRIIAAEAEIDSMTKERRRLTEQVLPSLMDEAGLSSLTLTDGATMTRGEQVYASIAKDRANEAAAWLVENGYSALVKDSISISFDKGDVKLSAKVVTMLTKAKIGFERRSAVHPQTLVAFVKESLTQGRKLPESISCHVQPCVVLKQAKRK